MAIAGAINILLGLDSARFTAGASKASGSLRKLKGEAAGLQGAMGSLNGVLGAFGVGIGISQTIGFLGDSVRAFEETHKASLRLNAVLEATGGVSGRSAEQLNDLADNLERITAVDDAVIKGGAAVLATFKSLSGDGFDRALKASIDLAAAMETDVKSAAMQLGKALSDPAEGLAALGRAGVKFTEEEKNLITAMVEANQIIEAQEMVLGKVESKVGGVAGKMATDIDKLATSWGNLKEAIGSFTLSSGGQTLIGAMGQQIEVYTEQFRLLQQSFDKGMATGLIDLLFQGPARLALASKNVANRKPVSITGDGRKGVNPLPPGSSLQGLPVLELPPGPQQPRGIWNDTEGVDRFAERLGLMLDDSLAKRQEANISAAQPRGFAGFASGNEMGSAGAFESIAAFKFGNAGQKNRTDEMTLEEAKKQNALLERQVELMKQWVAQPFQELDIEP